jgi:hypothetical protein
VKRGQSALFASDDSLGGQRNVGSRLGATTESMRKEPPRPKLCHSLQACCQTAPRRPRASHDCSDRISFTPRDYLRQTASDPFLRAEEVGAARRHGQLAGRRRQSSCPTEESALARRDRPQGLEQS